MANSKMRGDMRREYGIGRESLRSRNLAVHFRPVQGLPHFTGNRDAGLYSPFELVSFSGQAIGIESQYLNPGVLERLLAGLISRVRDAQRLRGNALVNVIFDQNGVRYSTGSFRLSSFFNTRRLFQLFTKISEVLSSADTYEVTGAVVGISFLRQ